MVNINQFINSNYDIVIKGEDVDENDLSTANEFLLGDIHVSYGHSAVNSLFINQFATDNDVILVEAVPALKEINADQAVQSVWLESKGTIAGWDAGTVGEITGSDVYQISAELEVQRQKLLKEILESKDLEDKSNLKVKYWETIQSCTEAILNLKFNEDTFLEMIAQTFPSRTSSMINTIEKTSEIYQKTFLIAGCFHLKHDRDDPKFSLEDFHQFLKSRKAVVLFPKDDKVDDLGKERVEAHTQVIMENLFLK